MDNSEKPNLGTRILVVPIDPKLLRSLGLGDSEETKRIIEEADKRVCDELHKRGMLVISDGKYKPAFPGAIHVYESRLKRELALEGIDWQTFGERNSSVFYD